MRIKDEFKKSGYFWLPAQPEKKLPGTLVITEGGKIQLELVGLFDESVEGINNFLSGDDNPKRIVGHIEGINLVTLEDCFYTKKGLSSSRKHHKVNNSCSYGYNRCRLRGRRKYLYEYFQILDRGY